jgi:serine aminopeptidase S33 family
MFEAKEETVAGGGGALFLRSWRDSSKSRAILAICPGFNSHGGYYSWVGTQCAAAGYATYAVDLRGRGKSAGHAGGRSHRHGAQSDGSYRRSAGQTSKVRQPRLYRAPAWPLCDRRRGLEVRARRACRPLPIATCRCVRGGCIPASSKADAGLPQAPPGFGECGALGSSFCLASSTQQMNSLRARGVMSFEASGAEGLAASALRRSPGSLCTAPPGTRWLLTRLR